MPGSGAGADQSARDTGVACIALVDVETTGLHYSRNELIELTILLVDVRRATGELMGIADHYCARREPTSPMSRVAQGITGIARSDLKGCRLDVARVDGLLREADLIVSHGASFDRMFLRPHVGYFEHLNWACSRESIDWQGVERQQSASIHHLVSMYDLETLREGVPVSECHLLAQVLDRPLPVSGRRGFSALLAAKRAPRYRFWIDDPGDPSRNGLLALGFEESAEGELCAVAIGPAAGRLAAALLDLADFDGAIGNFMVEPLAARGEPRRRT